MFGFLLQLLHRAFVPQDGSALGQGGTHGQDALVAGPPEPQPKVFQPNHKRTVYQYIGLCRKHWMAGDLGPDFRPEDLL